MSDVLLVTLRPATNLVNIVMPGSFQCVSDPGSRAGLQDGTDLTFAEFSANGDADALNGDGSARVEWQLENCVLGVGQTIGSIVVRLRNGGQVGAGAFSQNLSINGTTRNAVTLIETPTARSVTLAVDPDDGQPWTVAKINAKPFGWFVAATSQDPFSSALVRTYDFMVEVWGPTVSQTVTFYPGSSSNAEDGPSLVKTDSWTGDPIGLDETVRHATNRSLKSLGEAYFAAVQDSPVYPLAFGGTKVTMALVCSFDAPPIARSTDPDEQHTVFLLHETPYPPGEDLLWIGVTPSGRILAGTSNNPGPLMTPTGTIRYDGTVHRVDLSLDYAAPTLQIVLDGVVVLEATGGASPDQPAPAAGRSARLMLFNGRRALSRVPMSVGYAAFIAGGLVAEWPVSESSDALPALLTNPPANGLNFDLGLRFYDPGAIAFWGPVPANPAVNAYQQVLNNYMKPRDPVKTVFTEIAMP